MSEEIKWHPLPGFDGNMYCSYFFHMFENSDLAAESNERNFKKHLLLEFIAMLGVIHYHKDYDGCWEIVIKEKYGK
jgi:hypothetical protein